MSKHIISGKTGEEAGIRGKWSFNEAIIVFTAKWSHYTHSRMSVVCKSHCACMCVLISTSSCLLASSFLCMRDSLVRRLLKCMSLIMLALFVVTSFTDWENKRSFINTKNLTLWCVMSYKMMWYYVILNTGWLRQIREKSWTNQNDKLLFLRVVGDAERSHCLFEVFVCRLLGAPVNTVIQTIHVLFINAAR